MLRISRQQLEASCKKLGSYDFSGSIPNYLTKQPPFMPSRFLIELASSGITE